MLNNQKKKCNLHGGFGRNDPINKYGNRNRYSGWDGSSWCLSRRWPLDHAWFRRPGWWGLAWKSLSCFQMWMSLRISTSMAIVSMDTPLTQYGRTVVLELHELPSILNIRSETLWGQSVFHLNIQEPNNQYLQMIKTAFVGSQCLAGCRSAVFGPWSSNNGGSGVGRLQQGETCFERTSLLPGTPVIRSPRIQVLGAHPPSGRWVEIQVFEVLIFPFSKDVLPPKLTYPLKRDHFKMKVLFQTPIFRRYVSFGRNREKSTYNNPPLDIQIPPKKVFGPPKNT